MLVVGVVVGALFRRLPWGPLLAGFLGAGVEFYRSGYVYQARGFTVFDAIVPFVVAASIAAIVTLAAGKFRKDEGAK